MQSKQCIFRPGTIFNEFGKKINVKKPLLRRITVKVPARINAMVFDTKSLVKPEKFGVYTAGELTFSAQLYTKAWVKINKKSSKIVITKNTQRKSIVLHSALLMKKALNFSDGLTIEANNLHSFLHCGLGSSAALQIAVAMAINKIYGLPLKPFELMKFLSQNYGEEIENEENLMHVQSNGGGLAVALFRGGMIVLSGEAVIIKRVSFPKKYFFVFGIPKSYKLLDAKTMMEKEEKIFPKMKRSSELYAQKTAWNVLHVLLPALVEKNMWNIGNVIDEYRFESGSLENDGIMWPEMLDKISLLRKFRNPKTMPVLSSSSCGPAIFSLTQHPEKIKELFEQKGLNAFIVKVDNKGAIYC